MLVCIDEIHCVYEGFIILVLTKTTFLTQFTKITLKFEDSTCITD